VAFESSEAERIEAIKTWWKENWPALAAGVVVALAGIIGWQFYQRHQASQAAGGFVEYQRLISSINSGKTNDATRIADSLVHSYGGTPYAAQGYLTLASYLVSQDKLKDAAKRLQWVTTHAGDKSLRHVARLRQARVVWGEGQANAALKLLHSSKPGRYRSLYKELEGDILASQGKTKEAAQAYQNALSAVPGDDAGGRAPIQQKLDNLGYAGTLS
jgi:predicted negative regulator of RcsB-dependent stress response